MNAKNLAALRFATCVVIFLAGCLISFYAIRLQVKLTGLCICLGIGSLALAQEGNNFSARDKMAAVLTFSIIVCILVSSFVMFIGEGVQPVTDKIHVAPETVLSKEK